MAPSSVIRPRRLLDQRALVEVQGVGRVFGGLRVVGDHDDGLAVVAVEQLQQAQDFLGRMAVEVAGRLVADQQGRVGDDRARDRHALLLAAGEFVRAVRAAVGQADQLQRDLGVALALRGRRAWSAAAAARRSSARSASASGCRTGTRSRRGGCASATAARRSSCRCARRRPRSRRRWAYPGRR